MPYNCVEWKSLHVVSWAYGRFMLDFHRSDRGSNPGKLGNWVVRWVPDETQD